MVNSPEYHIILSGGAFHDLNRHVHFLAKISIPAADNLKDELLKDIASLKTMPLRHPFYERPWLVPGKYRHMISAGKYRIVYTVEEDTVYVDGVEDCREG